MSEKLDTSKYRNIFFASGDKDALNIGPGDRRFLPLYDPKLCEEITVTGQAELERMAQKLNMSSEYGKIGRELCDCQNGGYTGLPENACSECMNTGWKYPTIEDLK